MDLIFRYPVTPHEIGIDSFVFDGMAFSLTRNGYGLWILNPLSYFGLFPLSEPGGSVFLIASLHLLTGVTVEGSILLVDGALSAMGTLGTFLLAREFKLSDRFALLAAFVMSTAPEFVLSLQWQVPTRIAFTALIPFLLCLMIRVVRTRTLPNLALLILTGVLMMSFHRLTVLMAIVAAAYVATLIVLALLRLLRSRLPSLFLSPSVRRHAPWLSLLLLVAASGVLFASTGVLGQYDVGEIASGTSIQVEVLNLAVSLSRSSGLLLPLALFGVVISLRHPAKGFAQPFLVIAFVSFIPTLFLRQYTGYYTIPVTSIFIVVVLEAILARASSRRKYLAVAVAVTAAVLLTSTPIIAYEVSSSTYMTSQEYDLGLYAAGMSSRGTWIFNDGLYGARTASVSGIRYLPVGGATTSFQGPDLLINGFLNRGSLLIRPLPLSDITVESDSTFILMGVQAEADWASLLNSPVGALPTRLAGQYSIQYAVANAAFPEQFYAYGHLYNSPLLESANASRYALYRDSSVITWLL